MSVSEHAHNLIEGSGITRAGNTIFLPCPKVFPEGTFFSPSGESYFIVQGPLNYTDTGKQYYLMNGIIVDSGHPMYLEYVKEYEKLFPEQLINEQSS